MFEYQMNRERRTTDGKNKSKLAMDFLLKEKDQLGDKINTIYALSSFRNVVYNMMEKYDLTSNEVSVIMWAYPYKFFSREAMVDRLRIGRTHSRGILNGLVEKKFLDQYSDGFWMEQEEDKYSDIMDYTYVQTEDRYIAPRYRLARKGTRLMNEVINEVHERFVRAWPWEIRDGEIDKISYMKLPKKPEKGEYKGNYNYPPNWK